MFDRYVRRESLGSITRWLNETGVPTPWNATRARNGKPVRGTLWRIESVRKILGSPAMLGATVKTDGTPVTDNEGMVVYRADALVSRDTWERVQVRLAANPVFTKVNTWLLTQVAFCATCKAPMYGTTAKYADKKYAYYGCVHSIRRDGVCTDRRVKADELETAIGDELLALIGSGGAAAVPRYPENGDHRQARSARRDLSRQPRRHAESGEGHGCPRPGSLGAGAGWKGCPAADSGAGSGRLSP